MLGLLLVCLYVILERRKNAWERIKKGEEKFVIGAGGGILDKDLGIVGFGDRSG